MWLNQLKIAVIQEDMNRVEELLENIPTLANPKEREEASYLLQEATKIAKKLQSQTFASMQHLQKNLDFLNSTQVSKSLRFDVSS